MNDEKLEEFWIQCKQSMKNYYTFINSSSHHIQEDWSSQLNTLQKLEKYDKIEYHIHHYLTLYLKDIVSYSERYSLEHRLYHFKILYTNLQRWHKLRYFNIFKEKDILLFIFAELINSSIKKTTIKKPHLKNTSTSTYILHFIENQIPYYLEHQESINEEDIIHETIDFCIRTKQGHLLNKINKYTSPYYQISKYIEEKYQILFSSYTLWNGIKVMKQIEKREKKS